MKKNTKKGKVMAYRYNIVMFYSFLVFILGKLIRFVQQMVAGKEEERAGSKKNTNKMEGQDLASSFYNFLFVFQH